jgi:FkbM family methyltransferase
MEHCDLRVRCQDDRVIADQVLRDNEYRLCEQMQGWKIVDIGAHIGSFTLACLQRGAEYVECYEPCQSAVECWYRNLPSLDHARLYSAAISWQYGMAYLRHRAHRDTKEPLPSGNSTCLMLGDGEPVFTVPLSAVLARRDDWDLVKIDIEGSEYESLDHARLVLRNARRYIIESHMAHRHHEIIDLMTSQRFHTERIEEKEHGLQLSWHERD